MLNKPIAPFVYPVKRYRKENGAPTIPLPVRSTYGSAGYDFFAPEEMVVPPMQLGDLPVLLMTGMKASLPKDCALLPMNRSSLALKKGLILANGVGLVDSDYCDNPSNEGEIGFMYWNYGKDPVVFRKGDKIGQAIIVNWVAFANEEVPTEERIGGYGSTGE